MRRYLSPFDLRPMIVNSDNIGIEHSFNDDNNFYSPPPPPIFIITNRRLRHHQVDTTVYIDCYEMNGFPHGYDPTHDYLSGNCGASWNDLDRIGNTSLGQAADDWGMGVGDILIGLWGYAVATMVVFPLLGIWPFIQIPIVSVVLSHIQSSPFIQPESWRYLFPTCQVSIEPAYSYLAVVASLCLSILFFCSLILLKLIEECRSKNKQFIEASLEEKRNMQPKIRTHYHH